MSDERIRWKHTLVEAPATAGAPPARGGAPAARGGGKPKGPKEPVDPEAEKKHPRGRGGLWIKKGAGMEGEEDPKVRQLQNRLGALGYTIGRDGRFGPETDKAVKQFQADHKLPTTGEIDPATTAALKSATPKAGAVPDAPHAGDTKPEPEVPEGGAAPEPDKAAGKYGAKYEDAGAVAKQNLEVGGDSDLERSGTQNAKGQDVNAKGELTDKDKPKAAKKGRATGERAAARGGSAGGGKTAAASPKVSRDTLTKGRGMGDKPDKAVQAMQTLLDSIGGNLGEAGVDGRFGPDTARALRRFQRQMGLKVDGIFGKQTRAALTRRAASTAAKEAARPGASLEESTSGGRVQRMREKLEEAVADRQAATNGREFSRARAREVALRSQLEEGMPPWLKDKKADGKKDGDGDDNEGGGMKRCPSCKMKNPKGRTKCWKCKGTLAKDGDAKLTKAEDVEEASVSSDSLPDIPNKPGASNWVEKAGGLPKYIRRIAKHLQAKGKPTGQAIAIAVNAAKKMCASGDTNLPGAQQVNAKSRAEACASVADWNAKRRGGALAEALALMEGHDDGILSNGLNLADLAEAADRIADADDRRLEEAARRGGNRRAPIRRLPDGSFAPRGTGQVLVAGAKVSLPHKSGSGKVDGEVVSAGAPGKPARVKLTSGPDAGTTVDVADGSPGASAAKKYPGPAGDGSGPEPSEADGFRPGSGGTGLASALGDAARAGQRGGGSGDGYDEAAHDRLAQKALRLERAAAETKQRAEGKSPRNRGGAGTPESRRLAQRKLRQAETDRDAAHNALRNYEEKHGREAVRPIGGPVARPKGGRARPSAPAAPAGGRQGQVDQSKLAKLNDDRSMGRISDAQYKAKVDNLRAVAREDAELAATKKSGLSPAAERRRAEIGGKGKPARSIVEPGATLSLKGSGGDYGLPDGDYEVVGPVRALPMGDSFQAKGPDGKTVEVPMNGIADHDLKPKVDPAAAASRPRGGTESGRTGRSPAGRLRNYRTMSDAKLRATIAAVTQEGNDQEALDALRSERSRRGPDGPGEAGPSKGGIQNAIGQSKAQRDANFETMHGRKPSGSSAAPDADTEKMGKILDMESARASRVAKGGSGADITVPKPGSAAPSKRATRSEAESTLNRLETHEDVGGGGYFGERSDMSKKMRADYDVAVVSAARDLGLSDRQLMHWANSRAGRHVNNGETAPHADLRQRMTNSMRRAVPELHRELGPDEFGDLPASMRRDGASGFGAAAQRQADRVTDLKRGADAPKADAPKASPSGGGGAIARGQKVTIDGKEFTVTGKHTPTRWRLRDADGKQVTMADSKLKAKAGEGGAAGGETPERARAQAAQSKGITKRSPGERARAAAPAGGLEGLAAERASGRLKSGDTTSFRGEPHEVVSVTPNTRSAGRAGKIGEPMRDLPPDPKADMVKLRSKRTGQEVSTTRGDLEGDKTPAPQPPTRARATRQGQPDGATGGMLPKASGSSGGSGGDPKGKKVTIGGTEYTVTGKHTPTRWRMRDSDGKQKTIADGALRKALGDSGESSAAYGGPGVGGAPATAAERKSDAAAAASRRAYEARPGGKRGAPLGDADRVPAGGGSALPDAKPSRGDAAEKAAHLDTPAWTKAIKDAREMAADPNEDQIDSNIVDTAVGVGRSTAGQSYTRRKAALEAKLGPEMNVMDTAVRDQVYKAAGLGQDPELARSNAAGARVMDQRRAKVQADVDRHLSGLEASSGLKRDDLSYADDVFGDREPDVLERIQKGTFGRMDAPARDRALEAIASSRPTGDAAMRAKGRLYRALKGHHEAATGSEDRGAMAHMGTGDIETIIRNAKRRFEGAQPGSVEGKRAAEQLRKYEAELARRKR